MKGEYDWLQNADDLAPQQAATRWWVESPGVSRALRLSETVTRIRRYQQGREETNFAYARLYGSRAHAGFGIGHYARSGSNRMGAQVSFPVIRAVSDTLVSALAKSKLKAVFLTAGGTWELQERAQEFQKFADGQHYELQTNKKLIAAATHACVWGDGFLKVDKKGAGKSQRCRLTTPYPWEMLADDHECLYGFDPEEGPRSRYQIEWMDRTRVMGLYARDDEDLRRQIRAAKRAQSQEDIDQADFETVADVVRIVHGWHLPTFDGAGDGRYVVAIDDVVLLDEPWEKDHYPFVQLTLSEPLIGARGSGIAEQILGLQLEINVLGQKVQRGQHLMANGHWLIPRGSKINKMKVTNDFDGIEYTPGMAPTVITPEPLPKSIYDWHENLYNKSFQIPGVSQNDATANKPPGVVSGEAIDAVVDIGTKRRSVDTTRFMDAFIEITKLILETSAEIAEKNADFDVLAPDSDNAKSYKIRFKDAELQKNEAILKIYDQNAFSDDPAEKMSQVSAALAAGLYTPEEAKRLMPYPDTKGNPDIKELSYKAVRTCIDEILRGRDYKGPQPELNLEEAVVQVQAAAIQAWSDGCPTDRLKKLRDWINDAKNLPGWSGSLVPAAPPAGAPPGPGAPAGPAPPGGGLAVPPPSPLPGAPLPPSLFVPPPSLPGQTPAKAA